MLFDKIRRHKRNLERELESERVKGYVDNIFKVISQRRDNECLRLTKLCFQKCTFDRESNRNVIKYCNDSCVLKWERIIYSYLLDKMVVPDVEFGDSKVCYKTCDKVSVYQFLTNCKSIKLVLNELFGFVCKFRTYNYLHGNLHVYNTFVNPDTFYKRGRFYVIDYSNSFLLDDSRSPRYQRSSFLKEFDQKIHSAFFEYWDLFTMYVSLRDLDILYGHLEYLDNLVSYYVKSDILQKFLREYKTNTDTNILTTHLNKPDFVEAG